MIDFYCIYKKNNARAEEFLKQTVTSANKFSVKVTPFEGIYTELDRHLKEKNLKINQLGAHKIKTNGVIGCFLSHFNLWKMCIELNNPIGILEYDAVFVRPLTENLLDEFDHCLNLDYSRHLYLDSKEINYKNFVLDDTRTTDVNKLNETNADSKIKKPFKYINNNHIKGAFGYIIKPQGAKLLINATEKYGILPADIQMNLLYCNIHYTTPSLVMLNPESLIDRVKFSHTASDRNM